MVDSSAIIAILPKRVKKGMLSFQRGLKRVCERLIGWERPSDYDMIIQQNTQECKFYVMLRIVYEHDTLYSYICAPNT
jgi:hypothetical protein